MDNWWLEKRRILIVTWVSACWKTSLQEEILKDKDWVRPVNFSTREPRGDYELDEYCFLTKEQFEIKERHWDFIETTNYWGNSYWITKYLPEDKNIVIIVDPIWRTQIIRYFLENNIEFESIYLYINLDTQLERLTKRGDSIEEIIKRQRDFHWFWPTQSCTVLDWTLDSKVISDYLLYWIIN